MSPLPPGHAVADGDPTQFDERLYALRSGLQDWVTSPSTEIAGDLTALRLGVDQRWQTKRGPPDDRHIIDWITLDTDVTIFPDPTPRRLRPAGGPAGLRLPLARRRPADAGQRRHLRLLRPRAEDHHASAASSPGRRAAACTWASASSKARIDSKILTLSYSYWMSPKWVSSFGTTIDLAAKAISGRTSPSRGSASRS